MGEMCDFEAAYFPQAWNGKQPGKKVVTLPPTRMYHRGDKINQRGGVSALCFATPRAIDMKRATWTISDDAVTCPKCKALILARAATAKPAP